jgi:CIC family chloride channel protein
VRLRYSVYLKPLIGGLLAAALGLGLPHVLGNGRGLLASFLKVMGDGDLEGFRLLTLPLWLSLIILAIAKIVATGFSIASGGSGGVFAPGILSGAMIGASFGMLVGSRISPLDPMVYAYIGTAAFFGAAAKTPFASSVMVSEMGGNHFLIVPTFLAALVARELSGHSSIYASQLEHRIAPGMVSVEILLDSVKRARKRGHPRRIRLRDVVDRRYTPIGPDDPVSKAIDMIMRQRQRVVPLVNEEGRVCGALDLADLEMLLELGEIKPNTPARLVRLRVSPVMRADETLDRALEEMMARDYDYVIVVDEDGRYMGIAALEEIAAALAHLLLEGKRRRGF